jgi:hypothetical protein
MRLPPLAARLGTLAGAGSRAMSLLLGGLALVVTLAAALSHEPAGRVLDWAVEVLTAGFVAIALVLAYVALLALVRVADRSLDEVQRRAWCEAGLQAATGIASLALVYTLLGISLGIGSLAETPLTPATVPEVIGTLTRNFSMAFMTTVIGLPTATLLRALLLVTAARRARPPVAAP